MSGIIENGARAEAAIGHFNVGFGPCKHFASKFGQKGKKRRSCETSAPDASDGAFSLAALFERLPPGSICIRSQWISAMLKRNYQFPTVIAAHRRLS